jgi:hypothetical protein
MELKFSAGLKIFGDKSTKERYVYTYETED